MEYMYIPPTGDSTFIRCVLETLRCVTKLLLVNNSPPGTVVTYGQSLYLSLLVKWSFLRQIEIDIASKDSIPEIELTAIKFGVDAIARDVGGNASSDSNYLQHLIAKSIAASGSARTSSTSTPQNSTSSGVVSSDNSSVGISPTPEEYEEIVNSAAFATLLSPEQLTSILACVQRIQAYVARNDSLKFPLPRIDFDHSEALSDATEDAGIWSLFGRLRRDADVDDLAGVAPVPPIMRPIEMTNVPETVHTLVDVALVSLTILCK